MQKAQRLLRAGIRNQSGPVVVDLIFVQVDVGARTEAGLLLAGKECETDGRLGLDAQGFQNAGGLQNLSYPGAIVFCARACSQESKCAPSKTIWSGFVPGRSAITLRSLTGWQVERILDVEFDFYVSFFQKAKNESSASSLPIDSKGNGARG